MARPRLCRKIRFEPGVTYFKPAGIPMSNLEEEIMAFDELEALRLKDLVGLEQEQCADRMGISQPTFHRLITSARKKLTSSIVNGYALRIEGGNVQVIKDKKTNINGGMRNMRIAVASDDKETISHHFGRAMGFVVFDIKDGKVAGKEYRENIGKSEGECHTCNHDAMIKNIKDCDSVISHGMGMAIYQDLESNKIKAVVTDEDIAEEAVKKYLKGELANRTDRLH